MNREKIDEIIACKFPEGLRLEFKQKSDAKIGEMSKDDRRNITKTVTSFANSDGGILIIGIKTTQITGFDCASEIVNIADVVAFYFQVELLLATQISPKIEGLKTGYIIYDEECGSGVVWIEVPSSNSRPHMSIATGEHTFYKRGFNGSVPMTVSEVRDQILAIRDAQLEVIIEVHGGAAFEIPKGIYMGFKLKSILKNIGFITSRDPFVRMKCDQRTACFSYNVDRRGFVAWQMINGTLFFPQDEIEAARLEFGLIFTRDFGSVDRHIGDKNFEIWPEIHGDRTLLDRFKPLGDDLNLHIEFGSQNSVFQTKTTEMLKNDIIPLVLKNHEYAWKSYCLKRGIDMDFKR